MKISISKHAGFCPGVRRANDELFSKLNQKKSKIYLLGELIHNRLYNEKVEKLGAKVINISELESILGNNSDDRIVLIIRTHGITKELYDKIENLKLNFSNFTVSDMTCPFVKRIHNIAESVTNDKTVFLLYSDKLHPEAIGIMSYANGEKYSFSSIDELKDINFKDKIPILCSQTTQNLFEFEKIKKNLEKVCTNLIFYDTICSVTENRQNDALRLANECDAMIVIGGKESANTRKLYDLCTTVCPATIWIESAQDLTDFPDNANSVGIIAGASTPDDVIMEVSDLWKKKM